MIYKSTKVVHTNYEQKQFNITEVIKKIQKNITFFGKVTLFYSSKVFCFMDRFNLGLITSKFDFLAFKVDLMAII